MRGTPPAASGGKTIKLRDKAYARFAKHLMTRDILPGQFVSQRELVEITAMPLGAVRELIPRLEAEGLLVTHPRRGLQVVHADVQMIHNAFQFRLFLEKEAAACYALNATDEEIRNERESHEAILKKAEDGITDEVLDEAQVIDWSLHDDIIDKLDNEIISNAYRVNSMKIRLIAQKQARLAVSEFKPTMRDHMRLIEAFEARDAEAAREAAGAHIEHSLKWALKG